MRAAINQFFTRRHQDEKKLPKNLGIKKDLLFLSFYNNIVSLSKGVGGSGNIVNVFNAFLLNRALVIFSDYFLPLITLC